MESSCYVFNYSASYFVLLKAERENLEKKKNREKKKIQTETKKKINKIYTLYNE